MAKKEKKPYNDFIPYDKASKREKRKRDREKRNTWEIDPVSKVIPDKRRKKDRHDKRKKEYYYFEDEDDIDY